ncbi:MAG: paraquat-inducible protein A [Dinoroseobacter sp.]|nr:paraquat-inducible protein A [Dinoroseobacter sp.]MDJ0992739.1 paraquat-inducible protein A [Dinoroseobacter sp.]
MDSSSSLIVCPECDALHYDQDIPADSIGRCMRCGTVLAAQHAGAMTRITMLALAALVLMVAAIFFPFLDLRSHGLEHRASILDAILAFSRGPMIMLSIAVAVLIVALPVLRLLALVYVFAPMALGWHPARHAKAAFRFAEQVKPWSMAEIFIIGVAVALVKVAGIAKVEIGPAFWALAALVLITVLKDTFMCRFTVWKTLARRNTGS